MEDAYIVAEGQCDLSRREDDIDPIVAAVIRGTWESRRARININTVTSVKPIPQPMQRPIIDARSQKESCIARVMPKGRMVRRDVYRVRRDCNWRTEIELLPARCSLVGKSPLHKQCSIAAPQTSYVGACISD